MSRTIRISTVAFVALLFGGCSNAKFEEGEKQLKLPINCATAEGDIRLLQHEKAHTADQLAAGVGSISPAGAVVSVASGNEGEKFKIATGDYNRRIDARIAAIKKQCGVN